jgi:predicted metal-dependent enzyme (double-stranded beta helix superfamily)
MKKLILSVFIFTFGFAAATHALQVNTLLTKQLPEAPGKEIEVITVNYAPGAVDVIHRHDAHAVVYVLDGEVEMQVRGGTYEFKSRATQREWDRDCPSVRTVCARSFLSIRCG